MRFSFRRSPPNEFLARETPNCTLPRTCTHIPSMDMRERERFASQERSDEGGTRSVAMIHRMTETEPQGSVNTTCPSTRTNVRFQFAGAARTVLYARRQEQGAQRPEESTIIPFSESRYRSSDVGRAHYRRAKPIFYKCALRGYSSLYFASQSRSASTAFVRTKCGTHVLDGDTPIPRYTHEGQCV